MAKLIVEEATLREAIDFGNGHMKAYIATVPVPEWRGWSIYADTVGRELVVTCPGSKRRHRIPFEQVKKYVAGLLATKETTAEILATVPE